MKQSADARFELGDGLGGVLALRSRIVNNGHWERPRVKKVGNARLGGGSRGWDVVVILHMLCWAQLTYRSAVTLQLRLTSRSPRSRFMSPSPEFDDP